MKTEAQLGIFFVLKCFAYMTNGQYFNINRFLILVLFHWLRKNSCQWLQINSTTMISQTQE